MCVRVWLWQEGKLAYGWNRTRHHDVSIAREMGYYSLSQRERVKANVGENETKRQVKRSPFKDWFMPGRGLTAWSYFNPRVRERSVRER